jgi:tetratricopeptide (TPR) repeat protein
MIFKILFIFLSITTLYATHTTQLRKDIVDIKTELVKLQVSQKYENRDKQIEVLKKNIKSLEKKFHASEIDKNSIKNKFEKYDSIINRQDNRIRDFENYISIIGILVTVLGLLIIGILLVFGFKHVKNNKNIAKNEINNKDDKPSIKKKFKPLTKYNLDEIKDNTKKILSQETKEVEKSKKKRKEKILKFNIAQKTLSKKQKKELDKIIKEVNKKDEDDFNFDDLYAKFIDKYYKKKYNEALDDLDEALEKSNYDENKSNAQYNKGLTLAKLGESQRAIEVFDTLIEEFQDSNCETTLEQVASAYLHKGFRLAKLGESQKAIEVYNTLIEKFQDSKSEHILEEVASAYLNKALRLGKSPKVREVYDILIKKFKDSKSESIIKIVAKAKNWLKYKVSR